MAVKENPFTLTFGKEPYTYITRYEDLDTITETFRAERPVTQTMLIEGIRGSGKTVLMTMAANRLKDDKDWVIINLNPALDLLSGLAARLTDACRKTKDLLSRGFTVAVAGFEIGVGGDEKAQDSISKIEECLSLLEKQKKRVLITIDEVLPGSNMRIFASQFQIFVREEHPLFLIMTGLYDNIYAIQNDPALTFLLRSPKIRTEPLSILQITRQYRDIFDISESKANCMANLTRGYAFAFQALGSVYWNNREMSDKLIVEKLDELLDDFVYKKIWSSLTGREKEIVLTIDKDHIKTGEICRKINMTSSAFSKYRNSLIQKGVLAPEDHGYNSLALPRFNEIVRWYAV